MSLFSSTKMAKLSQMAPPFPALALMPHWFGIGRGKVQKVVLDSLNTESRQEIPVRFPFLVGIVKMLEWLEDGVVSLLEM